MGCGASSKPTARADDPAVEKAREKDQNKDFQHHIVFLAKVPLFKRLPRDEHPILAQNCEACKFDAGAVIIKQGDPGSEFFIIKSGEATVSHQGETGESTVVATLKGGDYFGENALLREEPRNSTITARTDMVVLKLGREKFHELGLHEKLVFAKRKAVGCGGMRSLDTKPPSPKTPAEKELIMEALRKNENLQTMVAMEKGRLEQMSEVAWKEHVKAGTNLITEGDLVADYFYIVQEGTFEVFVEGAEDPQSAEGALTKGESKSVSTLSIGDCFGELALLYLVPRAATVKAKTDAIVWVIDRLNFKNIMMKVSAAKIQEYVGYLNRVEILQPLLAQEKKAVAQALLEMHFASGEVILQEGEPGSSFYILYEGEVAFCKNGVEEGRATAGKGQGEAKIFGERALLNNEPRAATVMVTSPTAKALALDRDSFNMLLGPLEDIIKAHQAGETRPSRLHVEKHMKGDPNDSKRERIRRDQLKRIGLLGCGGFGTVELWEHIKTQETYALKGLSKGYIVKTGMQESVMNEKNILMMTNSPFIIKLWETYNGDKKLYFLLEPALGGELYATYNRKGFHGSDKHAKFYVAGVVEGFVHMHERRIIYRDLKPENLLLNETGRLKITDMGLAKFVIGKTYTTCGTPDYFAPELIASSGHTIAIDWWTLGVLVFELMSGHPPFESASPMQIYSKVMKGIGKVVFPQKCSGPVRDLILALLRKDPSERLPMRPGGVDNLRRHDWYKGFKWEAFQDGTMSAPYKPTVKSKTDIANFCARHEDAPRTLEYKDDGSGWDRDFASNT